MAHTPVVAATSGQNLPLAATINCLTCDSVTLEAHFTDHLGNAVVASVEGPANQALSVIVPGEDVRAPSFSYWLQAIGKPRVCDDLGCYGYDRAPVSGSFQATVDNVLTVRAQFSSDLVGADWKIITSKTSTLGEESLTLASGVVGSNGLVLANLAGPASRDSSTTDVFDLIARRQLDAQTMIVGLGVFGPAPSQFEVGGFFEFSAISSQQVSTQSADAALAGSQCPQCSPVAASPNPVNLPSVIATTPLLPTSPDS